MADPADQVFEVALLAGILFGDRRVLARIQTHHAGVHHPRLDQDFRIDDGRLVVERVALAAEALNHAHLVAVEISALTQPGLVVERDGVDDERIAFPFPHRVPVKQQVLRLDRVVRDARRSG